MGSCGKVPEANERKPNNKEINSKGDEGKQSGNINSNKINEGKENNNFIEEALKKHNEYRIKHNAPELKINKKLNEMADNYADKLLDSEGKKAFPLNIYNNYSTLGENILFSTKKNAEEMCEIWYNESKNYDYNLNKFQKGTGHFTQMIWKETKEVGFGFKLKDNKFCVVAYYYPSGNVLGEFSKNVNICK